MAAGIANGIGSFIQGLTGGVYTAHKMNQDDLENQLYERRLKLLESSDARDAAKAERDAAADAQDRQWKAEDRATAEAERQANAPLLAAKRSVALGELTERRGSAPQCDGARRRHSRQSGGDAGMAELL